MSYIDSIKERAKQNIKTICLPETEDKRTILAAAKVLEEGLANVVLVGNPEEVSASAKELGVDPTAIRNRLRKIYAKIKKFLI